MHNHRLHRLALTAAALGISAIAGTLSAAACDAPQYTFSLGLVQAPDPNHPSYAAAELLKKTVEDESSCKIEIKLFPSGQLGGDRAMFEAIVIGTQDMGFISPAPMSSFTPAVNGLSFPWLFDGDLGLMREALNGKPGTLLKAAIDKDTNTKTLGFIYSPFRNLVTIKPVDSVSDLHGLKLRTMESDLNVQTFRAVGADPTPIPFPEVYGALQTGVVDGFETDVVGMYSGKFQEVAKNVTISGHFNNVPLIVVNQAKWQSLSPDLQKIMEDAATEAGTLSYKRSLAEQSEYTKKLEDAGVKFHKIDISKLEQEAKAVYPEFEKKAPVTAEFVKAVQEMKKNKKE